jgi:hypothetical protein
MMMHHLHSKLTLRFFIYLFFLSEHGMIKPQRFNMALLGAILACLTMYLPTAIVGYHVYGSSLKPGPILDSLSSSYEAAIIVAKAFILTHVLSAYPIPMVSVVLEVHYVFLFFSFSS